MDQNILDVFGGLEAYEKLPVLNLDNSVFTALHDYVDFIKHSDMTSPIMRGIDKFNRHFVAFRLQFTHEDIRRNICCVLFQRYTDQNFWVGASNPPGQFDSFLYRTSKIYVDRIRTLIDHSRVMDVENTYYGVSGMYTLV